MIIVSLALMIGAVTVAPLATAYAAPADSAQDGVNSIGGQDAGNTDLGGLIRNIINILLYLIGAIAVIMIIIGGIRYTTSNGDASNTKSAKDTILYAVVGLVVAILAFAIVNFVLTSFR